MNENMSTQELKEQMNPGRMGGVFLLLLGGIFMLNNMGLRILGGNSWFLFMLIPVFWILVSAWRQYVANGRQINRTVFSLLTWGLLPFAMMAANVIFDISWSMLWPLGLILAGVSAMFFQPSKI